MQISHRELKVKILKNCGAEKFRSVDEVEPVEREVNQ